MKYEVGDLVIFERYNSTVVQGIVVQVFPTRVRIRGIVNDRTWLPCVNKVRLLHKVGVIHEA